MSGIAGLWHLDGRAADPAVIGAMSAALAHRGPDGDGAWHDGAVGVAARLLRVTPESARERQPLVGPSGAVIVFDGRLDNRDALEARLGLRRPAPDALPDAALALAAYDAWGDESPAWLLGDFAFAVFDPGKRRLLLARDAIGVRPLYYVRRAGLFAFASEIKALLTLPGIPVAPDPEGLAEYLMLGVRSLERQEVTCFAGVEALVPAHLAVVTQDHVTVRRYWDFDRQRRLALQTPEQCAEGFREHFAAAVRRRMRATAPIAVSVSGGLDSSAIFCQAETLRRTVPGLCPHVAGISYTADDGSTTDERSYLGEIERQYGLTIDRIPLDPRLSVRDGAEDQLKHIEAPFLDYLWPVSRALYQSARRQGARVLLSGHWGDQMLFSSSYLIDRARRWAWWDVRRHLKEYERWFLPGEARTLRRRFVRDLVRYHTPALLVPPLKWLRRHLVDRPTRDGVFAAPFLRRALSNAYRPADTGGRWHSAHAHSLYLEVRSKYAVHCLEWSNKAAAAFGLEAAFPMLDRDLVEFLMAVPGALQNADGVPRAQLRTAMRGVLPDAIVRRTWKADFSAPVNTAVARDYDDLERQLSGPLQVVERGFVRPDGVGGLLARARQSLDGPECVEAWNLTDLYGFELWLRVFFGERLAP